VLNYPTADEHASLGMICALRSFFPGCVIGYSDHALPGNMEILKTAVLLGARIVEKHFTHDKALPGNDHYHAMDKEDLAAFMADVGRLQEVVGRNVLTALPSESPARSHARRSLVTARPVRKGVRLTMEDLTWKRPAGGISPADIDQVLSLSANADLEADTVLQWRMLN
jgi:N-acetylneuraminate synthase